MNRSIWRSKLLAWGAGGIALRSLCACGAAPPGRSQKSSTAETPTAIASAAPSTRGDPGIDLQCTADRIRNAPAPFHWSYRKIVPPLTNADWEADVAPDSIVGTLFDGSGAHAIRGAISDSTSWRTAVLVLTGPLPASTFALVNNSHATVQAGTQDVNGEKAIKYIIDTTRIDSSEAGLLLSVLGEGGSVKGTVWVTRAGCPVKFVLDVEQHGKGGTTQKEHYEANATRR